jgi:DNA invertase Pin-like site-specific DNA recombinase
MQVIGYSRVSTAEQASECQSRDAGQEDRGILPCQRLAALEVITDTGQSANRSTALGCSGC